jgi:hypothetical protein
MDSTLESVRNWFNRIYLGGIPLMMNNDTAFLSFICVLTAIEALAGYRYPGHGETASPGERFRRFIEAYFPSEYHILADELWNFRNGMIHGFCPRRFALTEHQSQLHLRQAAGGATVLNAEDFYAALLMASRKYFAELEGSTELVSNFTARLQSDQGGNLAVGVIEIL